MDYDVDDDDDDFGVILIVLSCDFCAVFIFLHLFCSNMILAFR